MAFSTDQGPESFTLRYERYSAPIRLSRGISLFSTTFLCGYFASRCGTSSNESPVHGEVRLVSSMAGMAVIALSYLSIKALQTHRALWMGNLNPMRLIVGFGVATLLMIGVVICETVGRTSTDGHLTTGIVQSVLAGVAAILGMGAVVQEFHFHGLSPYAPEKF